MAEIHIEKKRNLSPLIWLILLIVLAVAGWWVYTNYFAGNRVVTQPASTTSSIPAVPRIT